MVYFKKGFIPTLQCIIEYEASRLDQHRPTTHWHIFPIIEPLIDKKDINVNNVTITTLSPLNPNYIGLGVGGGVEVEPCDVKLSEKCMFPYHNNTTLMKQISMVNNTALIHFDQ